MKIVFFTGAGISAESGIPTFRDYKDDAHDNYETLVTLSYFKKNPDKTWNWLNSFLDSTKGATYNKAHELIAFTGAPVITQNIDTFHQKAGSKNVVELHGTIGQCTCLECGKVQNLIDKCECGSYTKPNFTFFEEDLSYVAYRMARDLAKEADIFVIVGTSGKVWPAANLPKIAKYEGAKIYEINPGLSGYPHGIVDKFIQKSASEGIQELIDELKIPSI